MYTGNVNPSQSDVSQGADKPIEQIETKKRSRPWVNSQPGIEVLDDNELKDIRDSKRRKLDEDDDEVKEKERKVSSKPSMEKEFPLFALQTEVFQQPNAEIATQTAVDEDSEELLDQITAKLQDGDKHWSDFTKFINYGPPPGYKLEQGEVWMHKP